MKSAAKRLATTSSSEASVWRKRPSSNFEEKLYLFLRGPTRPSGVRSTRPSAPSSRTAVSARAAREREAAPELSSGRDDAAREADRARLLREASSVRRPRGDDAAAKTASGVCREGAPSGRGRPRCWGGLWLSVTCSAFGRFGARPRGSAPRSRCCSARNCASLRGVRASLCPGATSLNIRPSVSKTR